MNNIPFTYPWLIKKNIDWFKVKTILELGCGQGAFADLINTENKYVITGMDIFQPYLNICKKKGTYMKLIKRDLTKRLPFKNKSFDAVVCLQTIEHLDKKEGLSLLLESERVAKKIVLISLPNGECQQGEYDNNKYQRHLSEWKSQELKSLGYKIYGTGLKLVYGKHSHISDKVDIPKIPLYLFSFLMNPLTYIFPDIAAQIVAVKAKK